MTTMNLFQESKDGPRLEIECTFLNLIRHSNKTREEKKTHHKRCNGEMSTTSHRPGINQGRPV